MIKFMENRYCYLWHMAEQPKYLGSLSIEKWTEGISVVLSEQLREKEKPFLLYFPEGCQLRVVYTPYGVPDVYNMGIPMADFLECQVDRTWIPHFIPKWPGETQQLMVYSRIRCITRFLMWES